MAANIQGTIYLLHFKQPFVGATVSDGRKVVTCQHYLGWTQELAGRLYHHAHGSGARLTAAVAKAGIQWDVARTWQGTRYDERRLHNYAASNRLCPICSGPIALSRMILTPGDPYVRPQLTARVPVDADPIPF